MLQIAFFLYLFSLSHACPNQCSGNGYCDSSESVCTCFHGYTAPDCSQKICAFGKAWVDPATSTDEAHADAECSNMGECNRDTGVCSCQAGFTGAACERMSCPNSCSGHGVCKSMKLHAASKDPSLGVAFKYDEPWDANKIYGCVCDEGFTGYDCSLRECPYGDDPLTTNAETGADLDEIQLMQCSASDGFFTLSYMGETSPAIPVDAGILSFQEAFKTLPIGPDVSITFSEPGKAVCSITVNQVVSFEFNGLSGDAPMIVSLSQSEGVCPGNFADDQSNGLGSYAKMCGGSGIYFAYDGDSLASTSGGVITSVRGSKEHQYCSNRGICDHFIGKCTCIDGYSTSNGKGGQGIRGDCGHPLAEISACPGAIPCSGNGYCAGAPTFKCACTTGYTGADCSLRVCPTGPAWFDLPIADNTAHSESECSNMGICDRVLGKCLCNQGFEGNACQYKSCPGSPCEFTNCIASTETCHGHGTCYSMEQLATFNFVNGENLPQIYGSVSNDPSTWDFDSMYGCLCENGYTGHDCTQLQCPTGNDPDTGVFLPEAHEMQLVSCEATSGTFTLSFRSEVTPELSFDISSSELTTELLKLSTITSSVEVIYSSGSSFCTSDGSNTVQIYFRSELGNLPSLVLDGTNLVNSGGSVTLAVSADGASLNGFTSVAGTIENAVCSNRGICDHDSGKCDCFYGYGSSDGNGNYGSRGDCGWRNPYPGAPEDRD